MTNLNQNTNQFKAISTKVALEMLKRETAYEMGIELGANQTSKNNGKVGAEMTKKLVALGKMNLEQMMRDQGAGNVEVSQILNDNNENQLH
jgi:hypothetical protein